MSEEEWVFIGLDEKMAKRQGLPANLPVPKSQFEGLADKGLNILESRKWVKDFLTNSPMGKDGAWRKKNSNMVTALEGFLDKAPLWEKAQEAFSKNDYEKAISALKKITVIDADDHMAKLNLASAQANMSDHASALKNFKAVKKTFEGDPEFHVGVGHVHLALQQNDEAVNEFVLALEAKGDHQPALEALSKMGVLSAIYENPKDAASLLYVRSDAVLEYLVGQWDAGEHDADFFLEQLAYHERERRPAVVLAAAERAAAKASGAALERAELARIAALRSLGRVEDALAAVTAFAEKNPKSAGAEVERSRCLLAAGKADDAKAAIDRALAIDPGDLQALNAKYWPADPNDIQSIFNKLPELEAFAKEHPESAGAWRSVARAKLACGGVDEALDLFAKAVALDPTSDDLRSELWAELAKQQRYDQILADAGKIENMKDRDWKLRWNEAEAYAGLGKKVEARALFSAINFDERLHVDIRKRAKRAVHSLDEPAG